MNHNKLNGNPPSISSDKGAGCAILILLAFVFTGALATKYLDTVTANAAIQAGLVQDTAGHWVKP